MLSHLRPALSLVAVATLLLGLAGPLAFVATGLAIFPSSSAGSLVERDGHPIGSALVGQSFTGPRWFHPRPSAITGTDPKHPGETVPTPYDASTSSASNLAPGAAALRDRVRGDLAAAGGPGAAADSVTTSGSGLDPDISPENARRQIARVAAARRLPAGEVGALVRSQVTGGLFWPPRVSVLRLNLALEGRGAALDLSGPKVPNP